MATSGQIAFGAAAGGLGSFAADLIGGIRAERFQRRMRRRQRKAIAEARQFADETVQRVTSSDLFRQAEDFISGTFGDAANSPIVQDFRKGIQQAQASRGLFFGGASALQFRLQAQGTGVPYQVFLMLPYVVTLAVLAFASGRVRAPGELGRAYEREAG